MSKIAISAMRFLRRHPFASILGLVLSHLFAAADIEYLLAYPLFSPEQKLVRALVSEGLALLSLGSFVLFIVVCHRFLAVFGKIRGAVIVVMCFGFSMWLAPQQEAGSRFFSLWWLGTTLTLAVSSSLVFALFKGKEPFFPPHQAKT